MGITPVEWSLVGAATTGRVRLVLNHLMLGLTDQRIGQELVVTAPRPCGPT